MTGKNNVVANSLELKEKWGDNNIAAFLQVMATNLSDSAVEGQITTYAELVQLGVNLLHEPSAKSTFNGGGNWSIG